MKATESDTGSNLSTSEPKYESLDKSIWAYFFDLRGKNAPVSGDMLPAKAKTLALQIGFKDFCASQRWLQIFERRYNIGNVKHAAINENP